MYPFQSVWWDCCCLFAKSYLTLLTPHGLQPARLLCPWDFPGKNTGEGCHFLLQGIFPILGLNLCLLLWQTDSLPLSLLGSYVRYNIYVIYIWYNNLYVTSGFNLSYLVQMSPRFLKLCRIFFFSFLLLILASIGSFCPETVLWCLHDVAFLFTSSLLQS